MQQCKVELTATGPLTQIPDSQKLFGALIYLLAEHNGEQKATGLTQAMRKKEVHLALSDVMPEGYLPTPQDWLIDRLAKTESDNLKSKQQEIKRRSYVKLEQLTALCQQEVEPEDCYPFIQLQGNQQPRASLESAQHQVPGLEPKLYSVPAVYVTETSMEYKTKNKAKCNAENKTEINRPVKRFYFYLQTDDETWMEELCDMIRARIEGRHAVILGKRASQGLNTFLFTKVEPPKTVSTKGGWFLNTGMLLPDQVDLSNSALRLFTSERRPYEMVGGWDKNRAQQFISFIAPGSAVCAPGGPEKAGKCVASPFCPERDIVFGNAFLYPWPAFERGCGNG